jgi:hypothetical protein
VLQTTSATAYTKSRPKKQSDGGASTVPDPAPQPRTISFQPTPHIRTTLEKVRVRYGLRSRTTLINEALVLFLRPEFGKKAMDEEAGLIAKAEARWGKKIA